MQTWLLQYKMAAVGKKWVVWKWIQYLSITNLEIARTEIRIEPKWEDKENTEIDNMAADAVQTIFTFVRFFLIRETMGVSHWKKNMFFYRCEEIFWNSRFDQKKVY